MWVMIWESKINQAACAMVKHSWEEVNEFLIGEPPKDWPDQILMETIADGWQREPVMFDR